MNFIPIISVKNHVHALFTVILILLVNLGLKAQSKENPDVLKNKIAKAESNPKKVELLLALSDYYLTKTGENKDDLDNADRINTQANLLSDRLKYKLGKGKSILLGAKIYREKGDVENALEKTKNAIVYSKTNNLTELQASSYAELSIYDAELEQKAKYKQMAIQLFKKAGAKEQQATVLKELGELYSINEQPDKAENYLKESLEIYKTIKFKSLQGVYNLLSEVNTQKGNYPESLKYALLAEKTALAVRDNSLQLSSIYNHVGLVYYYLRQNDDAEQYWFKAFEIAKKFDDTEYVRTIGENLCSLLIRQKKEKKALELIKEMQQKFPSSNIERIMKENYLLFNIYRILNNNATASIYYKKLADYYGENADRNGNSIAVLRSFASYHYQIKKYDEFYKNVKRLDSLAAGAGNNLIRSESYLIWFKADSSRGDYINAIKHYQLYKSLSDSVFKGEKSKQINSLQIEFESEKKDKNINLLQEQAKVQQIQIQKDTVVKYVFIGSVIFLILFLALLYNSFRLKKKKNEELEIQRQQINEQNELNKKMLIEKEWLLKEIHHRVKNNLQIVISLLNTQSAYLDNEDALMAIQNSQHRMHAMSLIHQKLYQSDNLANIDMSWYVYELINYMKECFDTDRNINFVLEVEKTYLDVAQAVPLGLIINEAVNNAIKYAFPENQKGKVIIVLKNIGENNYELQIADNGVGLPEDFENTERDSLGMNLMMGLSDQIDGTFEMKNDNGLKIKITFTRNTEFEVTAENS
ncbi:two-component sensor histidine kinase [Flavobacterium nitrogenifigens]|uniref:histidine kinase n=2 Tax=Flavobacterium TaxID=237 RepID=A0A7W7J1M8_9FLAO|nr:MULTISPECIES: histidine kinase dimerization/phosphoacceptor domain -containing protein [Flavobacterium]MBB4804594.1 two-component sensor histidine kinase [Flavobacterium nitrogenifigens]MBB6389553.1 two-component sensor histidine kinase [Flavobacterium notoginsengisoli]